MKKPLGALTALCLLAFSTTALAQDAGIPKTGFFAGLGGSYNWAKVDQDLKGIGISEVLLGSTLVLRETPEALHQFQRRAYKCRHRLYQCLAAIYLSIGRGLAQ